MPKQYNFVNIDDDDDNQQDIYKFDSEIVNLPEVENYHPKFSYINISFEGTKFCFNNSQIPPSVFIGYFESLKEISNHLINDIFNGKVLSKKYHTHFTFEQISKKREIRNKILDLLKVPNYKRNSFDFPLMGQFGFKCKVVNEAGETIEKAPRIFFVIGNQGVFHPLLFDLEHDVYCMPDHK